MPPIVPLYRQNALFAGQTVLRLRPEGVAFGLLGSPAPSLPARPLGTALRAGELEAFGLAGFESGMLRPGALRDDDPGVRGAACGSGCAGDMGAPG